MDQVMPAEELARQRLNALIFSYTLLIKHLKEEGVALEKVKKASDKVWAVLGSQVAEQMKPLFPEPVDIEAIFQAAQTAEAVHGIDVRHEVAQSEIYTEFVKCPWQEAYIALGIPEEWRLCPSGHVAFTESMYKGLNPAASYELTQDMPSGAAVCAAKTSI
jgi:hypothetical protein